MFGGAYVRREICVLKSIGLALFLVGNLPFFFVLLCFWGQFPSTSPQRGLYLEGRFNGGFFALRVWGAYIWRGLYMEGLIFGILWYNVIQNRAENAGTCCKWPLRVPQDNQERQKFQDYELRILIIHKFTSILIFLAGGTWVVWEETAWKETKTKKTSRRNSRTNLVPASHVYHSNGVISSWLSFRTFCDCSDLKTLIV